jgi:hypothetical protein
MQEKTHKKEECPMKYEKPAVVLIKKATEAILGQGKPNNIVTEDRTATLNAYEADE